MLSIELYLICFIGHLSQTPFSSTKQFLAPAKNNISTDLATEFFSNHYTF